jgi:transcription antitermination factor NusG
MGTIKKWYAVYNKPRTEKKVYSLFEARGIESYCPLNKVNKQWSDRVKLVEEPLFKSYVFVHIAEAEQSKVRMISGVLNFVYWLGKPAVIKQVEIDRIKRFFNDYEDVIAEPITLKPDDSVIITSGALMDKEAKVIRRMGNRVELEIESLGYKLVDYVERKNIRRVGSREA